MDLSRNITSIRISVLYSYLFFVGIISNMVLPSIFIGINWHPAIFFSFVISFFLVYEVLNKRKVKISGWLMFPVGLLFIVIASDFYGKVVLGVEGDNSPLFNILLLIFTFIPYVIAISNIKKEDGEKAFFNVTNLFFVIFFVISLLQAFGPKYLSVPLIDIYAYGRHISTALSGGRYTLTGPDPNVGSVIAAFFIIFYFVFFIKLRSWVYLLFFVLSMVPLFLSQGRTVMIGLALSFFVYLLFFSKLKIKYKILFFLALLSLPVFIASFLQVDYLTRGISELLRGENNSVNVRIQKSIMVFENFFQSPVIGQGANLEQYRPPKNIDSEYMLLLQRHGIIGFIFVVGALFILAFNSLKSLRYNFTSHILILLCGLATFVMLTNVFVFSVETFGVLIMMIYFSHISGIIENPIMKLNSYNETSKM